MHAPVSTKPKRKKVSAFWMRQLHSWHWISSAVSLVGLLLFAFTGITLNHAADLEASPQTVSKNATLPDPLLKQVAVDGRPEGKRALPADVASWVKQEIGQNGEGEAEWSAGEIYLPRPRPGGDGWVAIDRATGAVTSESTSRGWLSYLNDLHKGRNAGTVWFWFIDIFAIACFLFALTGLLLLQLHAAKRPSTWPLVATGLAIPAILAIIFIH